MCLTRRIKVASAASEACMARISHLMYFNVSLMTATWIGSTSGICDCMCVCSYICTRDLTSDCTGNTLPVNILDPTLEGSGPNKRRLWTQTSKSLGQTIKVSWHECKRLWAHKSKSLVPTSRSLDAQAKVCGP